MGPIVLFDKSFLQSLSVDDSVWFDHFFMSVVCPIFYLETLADLAKEATSRGPAESAVRVIASKFPEFSGKPCLHHNSISINNLLGHRVPLNGNIPMAGGRPTMSGSKKGVIYDESPEASAFQRWQNEEFMEVERRHAHQWREELATLDLDEIAKHFRALGIDGKRYKTLEEIKEVANTIVCGTEKPFDRMALAINFFNVPRHLHEPMVKQWTEASRPPLVKYAPYAAFVLTVEVFFQLALAANLISAARASNRMDIAYLFYLPFCMVFVSGDNLHRKCAPLFMREDQEFVWGPDLKKDLSVLNEHYKKLPKSTQELGISNFAKYPPKSGDFLVSDLWDRHAPRWREQSENPIILADGTGKKLMQEIESFRGASPVPLGNTDLDLDDMDMVVIQHKVSKQKGSWWQLPKDLEISDED